MVVAPVLVASAWNAPAFGRGNSLRENDPASGNYRISAVALSGADRPE
jgi:hypothetical protein